MNAIQLSSKQRRFLQGFLCVLLVVKLLTMWQTPVDDPSESRYAEISRKMVETGDWITPQFDYGIPFWAKPPLSTWASAAGIATFGDSAFAARLPILIISIGILYLLYCWINELRGKDMALAATAILASIPIYNFLSSAVMTDLCLTATTTLCMVAFHRSVTSEKKQILWPYLFFIGVGLGFLAKGPAATVLAALPIFAWALIRNQWSQTWTRLPWIAGTLITVLIAAPWYLLAESKTPGFINYFIIGEHFNRFLVTGWKGDLYGSAHQEPLGYIWIFWLLTAIPWSFVIIVQVIKNRSKINTHTNDKSDLTLYISCWFLAPLIFFTFARNIIPTYVFTGIPALPFLIVELYQKQKTLNHQPSKKTSYIFAALASFLTLLFTAAWIAPTYFPEQSPKSSQREVVSTYLKYASSRSSLNYWKKRYPSAEFYTHGKAQHLETTSQIEELLANDHQDYLVTSKNFQFPPKLEKHFETIATFKKVRLLREQKIN